jgi:hypothetical protein
VPVGAPDPTLTSVYEMLAVTELIDHLTWSTGWTRDRADQAAPPRSHGW